jgi:DNA invertase Pin-like site-specific DNA recombinase
MSIVHSYLRFSSKKQEHGDSKRRQKEGASGWASRNGHTLSTLQLEDLGVSAFRGRNRHTGALKRFLQAIEEGRVKPGEILLIEALDRLSREGIADAYRLFMDILAAGVQIAVLTPAERLYTKKSVNDFVGLLEPLMSFHLGWEESQKKSVRISESWAEKRRQCQEKGTPLNRKCPGWLMWNEETGRFEKKTEGAKAVRYIFQRTVDGVGQRALLAELTERFEPIGRKSHWNSSYVQKVLSDRAVLGELQLKTADENGRRIPQGEPVKDYYPRVIDDNLWYRAQQAKATRQKLHKGPSQGFFSLFTGLVINARDGHPCHIQTTRNYIRKKRRSAPGRKRRLVSYGHLRRVKDACPLSFDYYLFEAVVLAFLSELKPSDVMPAAVAHEDLLGDKSAELHAIDGRLAELNKHLQNPDTTLTTVIEAAKKLEHKRAELREQIERLKREQAADAEHPLAQTQSLMEMLQAATAEKKLEIRTKLRVIIPTLVEAIYIVPIKRPANHVFAWIQICLHNGTYRQLLCTNKKVCGTPEAFTDIRVDFRLADNVRRVVKQTEKIAA